MKTSKNSDIKHAAPTGFTLVELLVVITIIVILAAVTFVFASRAKVVASKSTAISQMRNIGVAVAVWSADQSSTEPFYFANGTATYPSEAGGGTSVFTPGNPAMVLYNRNSPESGYITDRSYFFSPLVKYTVPDIKTYDPSKANAKAIWGTYAWVHPFVEVAKRSGRQMNAIQNNQGQEVESPINPAIAGRFVMMESYDDNNYPPKYGKKIYNALMIDGSVQYIADTPSGLSKWRRGQ